MAELLGQPPVVVVVKVGQEVTRGALYRPVGEGVHHKTGVWDLLVKRTLSVGVVVKAAVAGVSRLGFSLDLVQDLFLGTFSGGF